MEWWICWYRRDTIEVSEITAIDLFFDVAWCHVATGPPNRRGLLILKLFATIALIGGLVASNLVKGR